MSGSEPSNAHPEIFSKHYRTVSRITIVSDPLSVTIPVKASYGTILPLSAICCSKFECLSGDIKPFLSAMGSAFLEEKISVS